MSAGDSCNTFRRPAKPGTTIPTRPKEGCLLSTARVATDSTVSTRRDSEKGFIVSSLANRKSTDDAAGEDPGTTWPRVSDHCLQTKGDK